MTVRAPGGAPRRTTRGAALAAALALAAGSQPAFGWGFVAHRIVAESAAAAMPAPLASWFRDAARALSAASIEPDSRLKARDGEAEKRRHYLDLEDLGERREIPADFAAARALYGARTLEQAGLLPWRVGELHAELVEAFRRQDPAGITRLAGWLSHYAADACQPLHTTSNHDGQRTNNRGIHSAFETDLIDMARPRYRQAAALPAGFSPEAIADPAQRLIREILAAHEMVDAILKADRESVQGVRRAHADYWKEMQKRAGPVAERQLARAAGLTASLWHSAWVAAGRPELPAKGRRPVRGDSASRSSRPSPRR